MEEKSDEKEDSILSDHCVVSGDSDDDYIEREPCCENKKRKMQQQGETLLQQEYINFLVKINNADVDDYIQKIKEKYEKIRRQVEIFLETEQQKELENLQKITHRKKTSVLGYGKHWRKLKRHYENSGVDEINIMIKCF